MEALKSTALVPGEPEYKTEYNLLNMLLFKVPKHVDLKQILKAKPLQPRHCLALQELHSELFPIQYDPRFFEVACSTECGYFDSKSFWDFFDFKQTSNRDAEWYDNQIMSIGLFLPRSYVSFFRKTGEYEVEKYLKYLVDENEYTEFDDPLTEMLVYDSEYDEFMVGFVTLLINMDVTNNLISDDDYTILTSFYRTRLLPAIYSECVAAGKDKQKNENSNAVDVKTKQEHENIKESKENEKERGNQNESENNENLKNDDSHNTNTNNNNTTDNNSDHCDTDSDTTNDSDNSNTTEGGDSNDYRSNSNSNTNGNSKASRKPVRFEPYDEDDEEMVNRIRKCVKVNEHLFNDSLYAFIYNQLYTNELLLEYTSKFSTKTAKSLYILSTGITMGLRSRSLGTNLILFVQLLTYFVNHGFYVFQDKYYRLFDQHLNSKSYSNSNSNLNLNKLRDYYHYSDSSNEAGVWDLRDGLESARNILNVIKNYYNNKVLDKEMVYTYYNYVLESNYVPYNCESIISSYFEKKKVESRLGEIFDRSRSGTRTNSSTRNRSKSDSNRNSNSRDSKEKENKSNSNTKEEHENKNKTNVTDTHSTYNNDTNNDNEYSDSIDYSNKDQSTNSLNSLDSTNTTNTTNSVELFESYNSINPLIPTNSDELFDLTDLNDSSNPMDSIDFFDEEMPLVIYLHTIYYNEFATRVYENLNFYHIATIPDYYFINDKKYDARFLAYYIYL